MRISSSFGARHRPSLWRACLVEATSHILKLEKIAYLIRPLGGYYLLMFLHMTRGMARDHELRHLLNKYIKAPVIEGLRMSIIGAWCVLFSCSCTGVAWIVSDWRLFINATIMEKYPLAWSLRTRPCPVRFSVEAINYNFVLGVCIMDIRLQFFDIAEFSTYKTITCPSIPRCSAA